MEIKFSQLYWLLGRQSSLSIYNKILIYKQVLKPVWTYGIQLWGCSAKNNISKIQKFQNKVLCTITNCPWYIRTTDLHRDLGIEPITTAIKSYAVSHMMRLHVHPNEEASRLAHITDEPRRLRRMRIHDLLRSQYTVVIYPPYLSDARCLLALGQLHI